jgi:hypothetical protein
MEERLEFALGEVWNPEIDKIVKQIRESLNLL